VDGEGTPPLDKASSKGAGTGPRGRVGKIFSVHSHSKPLQKRPISGGGSDNDIRIEDKTVSQKHLKLETDRGKLFVTDLGSRNETFCAGNS